MRISSRNNTSRARRSRLVEDTKHVETCDPPGRFGGASLKLVEVRGNGHDGLPALRAECALREALYIREIDDVD